MSRNVLQAGEDCDLAQFLSRRGAQAHLLMPEPLLAALRAQAPAAGWTGSPAVADLPAQARRIFVHDPQDEPGLLAAARAARPQALVLGVLQHVIPALVADRHLPKPETDPAALPAHRFAVVCTPRTGSTFLCELLQAGGLGAPKEHLRAPLVHVLRSGQVDTDQVYATVMRQGSADGVFGTKLISHFLFDAAGGENRAAGRLACMAAQGFRFLHLRRGLIDQAVSKHMASHSGVWHARGQVTAQARQRLGRVPYDFDRLLTCYRHAERETQVMDAAVATLDPAQVLPLDYDTVTAQPLETLARCAAFLGLPARAEAVAFDQLPTRLLAGDGQAQSLRQRFEAELAALPR